MIRVVLKPYYGLFRGLFRGQSGEWYTTNSDYDSPDTAMREAIKLCRIWSCEQYNLSTFDDWTAIASVLGSDEANRIFEDNKQFSNLGKL